MKTIYSIRTSLGREVWWTTHRAAAIDLAASVTQPGECISEKGKVGIALRGSVKGLGAHELPLAVYRCTRAI